MICPNCVSDQPEWADTCVECGAQLSFLRSHRRRVSFGIWAAMVIGLGLLIALFASLFDQLVSGGFPYLGAREGVELVLGIALSLLGARAWATLKDTVVQRLAARAR